MRLRAEQTKFLGLVPFIDCCFHRDRVTGQICDSVKLVLWHVLCPSLLEVISCLIEGTMTITLYTLY